METKEKKKNIKIKKLELLVTIVNKQKMEFYTDLITSMECNYQLNMIGDGTVASNILSLLGLSEFKKGVILSIVREDKVTDIMDSLEDKFKTIKNGKGIAFSIPLSSIVGANLYAYLINNKEMIKGGK